MNATSTKNAKPLIPSLFLYSIRISKSPLPLGKQWMYTLFCSGGYTLLCLPMVHELRSYTSEECPPWLCLPRAARFNRKWIRLREESAFQTTFHQPYETFYISEVCRVKNCIIICFYKDCSGLPVEDQDLVVDRFGHQGCVLSSTTQAQTAGGQALSMRDPPRQPRFHTGVSGEGGKEEENTCIIGIPGYKSWKLNDQARVKLFFGTSCAKRWKKNGIMGPSYFCDASPVRPWWQRHVGHGWSRHAGDLGQQWGIQDQSHCPAFQPGSLPKPRRVVSGLTVLGGVQQRGQAQHQQSSQHLNTRTGGRPDKQTAEEEGDKSWRGRKEKCFI